MHTRPVFFSDLLGPFINYVVSVGGRGGSQKLPIFHSKKTTKTGGWSKIANFETTQFMDGPIVH